MLNHGSTIVQLLLCLSSNQLFHPLHSFFCRNLNRVIGSGNIRDFPTSSRPICEPLCATNTFHRKQEAFLYEYPFHWVLLFTKSAQQNAALRCICSQGLSPFWLLKPASEHAHLLPRLSCRWTVLLPSDTHRKRITSITAVLRPLVTCLLTLLRTYVFETHSLLFYMRLWFLMSLSKVKIQYTIFFSFRISFMRKMITRYGKGK
jgi:hypothetical protein